MTPTRDIETRADCDLLVREFYELVMVDPLIGFLFVDVAKIDLETHLPKVAAFWETVLLGAKSYDGMPFLAHADLHAKAGMRSAHFVRWLALWERTIDQLFVGPVADQAKYRAHRVAMAFQMRLNSFPSPMDPPPGGPTLPAVTIHGG